jgi:dTDP-4-dehydrorhamnose reductase
MRLLIVGADGMLGIAAFRTLQYAAEREIDVWRTTRHRLGATELLDRESRLVVLDATNAATLDGVLERVHPDVVFNCVGVRADASVDAATMFEVNAVFPHRLAEASERIGARVVHVSTDAVFSGRAGRPYDEASVPDPVDDYGVAKARGELRDPPHLTVRTSIIGRSPVGAGLVDWAIAQRGCRVAGFARVLWSGVTAQELVRLLEPLLTRPATASGLVHVTAEAVSKAELLRRLSTVFELDLRVSEVDEPDIDRRLTSVRDDLVLAARPLDEQLRDLANA